MQVNYCGIHAIHTKGFRIARPHGSNDYLFLHLKAPTRFHLEEGTVIAQNNEILLYRKGTPQFYEGVEDLHIDDFMHFSPSNDEDVAFMNNLALSYDRPLRINFLQPLLRIHQDICLEYMGYGHNREESVNCLVRYFLIKLEECMVSAQNMICQSDLVTQMHALRIQIYSSPNKKWTVSEMAQQVNLSPSYFQAMYKRLFHIACIADLITSRMVRAKQMLTFSSMSVSEIATFCGYDSESYFSRHFKANVGMSPKEYHAVNRHLKEM